MDRRQPPAFRGLDSTQFLLLREEGLIEPAWEPGKNEGNSKAKGRPVKYMWKGAKLHGAVPNVVYDRIVKRVKAGENYERARDEEIARWEAEA